MGQIYTILKYIEKEIETIYDFLWNKKNTISLAPSSNLNFERQTRYFRHSHSTKLSKNKMNLKVIKSHQCFLERSHAVFIELNSEFSLRPSPSSSRQIVRSNRHKNLQKQNNEDFLLQLLHFANKNFPAPTCIELLTNPYF